MKNIFQVFTCSRYTWSLVSSDLKLCTHICGGFAKVKDVSFLLAVEFDQNEKLLKNLSVFCTLSKTYCKAWKLSYVASHTDNDLKPTQLFSVPSSGHEQNPLWLITYLRLKRVSKTFLSLLFSTQGKIPIKTGLTFGKPDFIMVFSWDFPQIFVLSVPEVLHCTQFSSQQYGFSSSGFPGVFPDLTVLISNPSILQPYTK